MRRAAEQAQVIRRATPTNLAAELAALQLDFASGRPRLPRFRYRTTRPSRLQMRLGAVADYLDALAEPLAAAHAARARELGLELAICRAVGSPALWSLARRRYACGAQGSEADELASRWLGGDGPAGADDPDDDPDDGTLSDDDRDPRSLLSRMRQEVGARRLPLRVSPSDRLSALAAIGPEAIFVVRGRRLGAHTVERTVLHEIEGHALPRHRAGAEPLGLFRLGTARGSDDQEGRALRLEEQAGLLRRSRRRELALRHLGCRAVEQGADFVETVRLLRGRRASPADAIRIAARAHRGGGLGREVVYLPAFLRVQAALAVDPRIDEVLAHGRVAVDAAPLLAGWLERGA